MKLNKDESSIKFTTEPDDTGQLRRIIEDILPDVIEHFAAKNKEYGEASFDLGTRGQFSDIWRKIGKLRTALWDEEPERLTSESVEEVIGDLIGHLLMTLDMLLPRKAQSFEGRIGFIDDDIHPWPPTIMNIGKMVRVSEEVLGENKPDITSVLIGIQERNAAEKRAEDMRAAVFDGIHVPHGDALLWSPPSSWRGNPAYLVLDADGYFRVKDWSIKPELKGGPRCGWHYGEIGDEHSLSQCIGSDGHIPDIHINRRQEVWR